MKTMDNRLKSRNFKEYKVWNDAVAFATMVYEVTSSMPWFEKKGLCDQLQRAVVSISSNIAEGAARPTDADFVHFLDCSLGSCNEVETQLIIAKNINYINEEQFAKLQKEVLFIQRQLTAFVASIRTDK